MHGARFATASQLPRFGLFRICLRTLSHRRVSPHPKPTFWTKPKWEVPGGNSSSTFQRLLIDGFNCEPPSTQPRTDLVCGQLQNWQVGGEFVKL